MSLAQLLPVVLQASIALIVLSLGLRAAPGDLGYLLRRPGLLVRSLVSMNVVMPLLAVAVAVLFRLDPAVEAAILVLSVSPVPPILPGKQAKAGGNVSYAVGLLALSAVVAVITVPLSVSIVGNLRGTGAAVPPLAIAKIVAISVLAPLVAGAFLARTAPAFAERANGILGKIGTLLLVLGFLPVVVVSWGAITSLVGDLTILAIVLFTVAGLAVGHMLGGPAHDDRTVLALSTASRHPGVALAVVGANASAEARPIVTAAVLLCVLVSVLVTGPFVKWRRRGSAAASAVPA